jgi:hypothetical protein
MGLVASCLSSFAASCACSALNSCCGKRSTSVIPYLFLLFLSTAVALILRFYGGPLMIHLWITDIHLCSSDECLGFGAVVRISFSLFLFYLIHAIMTKVWMSFTQKNWLFKAILFAVIVILSFLIPDQFYDVYTAIARPLSGMFLLLQIIILIDFAYSWFDWTITQ